MNMDATQFDENATQGAPGNLPAKRLAMGSLLLVPVSIGAAMVAGTSIIFVGLAAAFFAITALVGARINRVPGRLIVALSLVGQAICITAALAGHPWQLDSHMIFFAVLFSSF